MHAVQDAVADISVETILNSNRCPDLPLRTALDFVLHQKPCDPVGLSNVCEYSIGCMRLVRVCISFDTSCGELTLSYMLIVDLNVGTQRRTVVAAGKQTPGDAAQHRGADPDGRRFSTMSKHGIDIGIKDLLP
jgi:hypothetical protein